MKDEKQEMAVLRIEEGWQERRGLTYLFSAKMRLLLTDSLRWDRIRKERNSDRDDK